MAELGVTLDLVRARCAQVVTRVKGIQRKALSIVLRRCGNWSSVRDRDIGGVRPVGDVCGFGFRLHRFVWLVNHGCTRKFEFAGNGARGVGGMVCSES